MRCNASSGAAICIRPEFLTSAHPAIRCRYGRVALLRADGSVQRSMGVAVPAAPGLIGVTVAGCRWRQRKPHQAIASVLGFRPCSNTKAVSQPPAMAPDQAPPRPSLTTEDGVHVQLPPARQLETPSQFGVSRLLNQRSRRRKQARRMDATTRLIGLHPNHPGPHGCWGHPRPAPWRDWRCMNEAQSPAPILLSAARSPPSHSMS